MYFLWREKMFSGKNLLEGPSLWVTVSRESPLGWSFYRKALFETQIYVCSSQLSVGRPQEEWSGTVIETFQNCFTLLSTHCQAVWATGGRATTAWRTGYGAADWMPKNYLTSLNIVRQIMEQAKVTALISAWDSYNHSLISEFRF